MRSVSLCATLTLRAIDLGSFDSHSRSLSTTHDRHVLSFPLNSSVCFFSSHRKQRRVPVGIEAMSERRSFLACHNGPLLRLSLLYSRE